MGITRSSSSSSSSTLCYVVDISASMANVLAELKSSILDSISRKPSVYILISFSNAGKALCSTDMFNHPFQFHSVHFFIQCMRLTFYEISNVWNDNILSDKLSCTSDMVGNMAFIYLCCEMNILINTV